MSPTQIRSHDELLTLARKVEAAAADADRDRLEAASLRLYGALLDHVDNERPDLQRLPPTETRLLTRGQQRVLDEIAELAARSHTPGPCQCAARAADVLARLYLQAADERLALAHLRSDGGSSLPE